MFLLYLEPILLWSGAGVEQTSEPLAALVPLLLVPLRTPRQKQGFECPPRGPPKGANPKGTLRLLARMGFARAAKRDATNSIA